MSDTGMILFQLFFMLAGVVGGIRIVADVQRWLEIRAESQDA